MQQNCQSTALERDPAGLEFLHVGRDDNPRKIAVRRRSGAKPGLFWLGGLRSDMRGAKATALDHWAAAHGRNCVRFDYSGHGESEGKFTDGTISRWLEESIAVFDAYCDGPQVMVGSSMGAWLALLLMRELRSWKPPRGPQSPAALILIAPAVDFTEELMWKRFPARAKQKLASEGVWEHPSRYSPEPYPITAALIEDGRRHLLLGGLIETGCPVRILQGVADPDVPWRHAVELVSRLAQDDVVLSLIKGGDHRLSRAEDIERLIGIVSELCKRWHCEASSAGPDT
jgi:pimeloyl-ACP methyl ester carboxylesterase